MYSVIFPKGNQFYVEKNVPGSTSVILRFVCKGGLVRRAIKAKTWRAPWDLKWDLRGFFCKDRTIRYWGGIDEVFVALARLPNSLLRQ